ncbi:MAG: transcriptional repressor NrdR [Chloroflexi bacterium]|nr:transcriptional repressor NrdR [Chloroflexota bacterium]
MKCPFCGATDSRVVDTREVGDAIRRRRECQSCQQRFTTYEQVAKVNLLIVKRDGRREPFDRQKLTEGIWKACAKRPISSEQIEQLVSNIESNLYNLGKSEVPSRIVGEMVMERLRELDDVAYVRFASVYRSFADLEAFQREVDHMIERSEGKKAESER